MLGDIFDKYKLVVVGSVVAISGLSLGSLWYRKYLKNQPPTKWMKVGEVEELCIYPVKSFKGIKPSSFECTPQGPRLGFMRDRSFLVVNEQGKTVTGRDYPKMTQMEVKISGTKIILSSADVPEDVEVDTENIRGERQKIIIWDAPTEGIDCGDEVAGWLSKCILEKESGLRLLYCIWKEDGKTVNHRIKAFSKWMDVPIQKSDGGFFSDGVSYHLISQASIKELNSRLDGTEVSAMNFRPNFIVKGNMLIPFEEDHWKWVKIGDVIFQYLAPCTRCVFTTVDPNTGEKSKDMEPLSSLRRYRQIRDTNLQKFLSSPVMGAYMGIRSVGNVRVGDEVFIPQI